MNKKIGFIGQGFIGKNYADDFESRGYDVVRYSLDEEYKDNKDLIKDCDIVFIAVPTPQKKDGFDSSILLSIFSLIGDGKIAVIKSTVKVGLTRTFQEKFKNIIIIHSPEFLTELSASIDAKFPNRNIIGISEIGSEILYNTAKEILEILPRAPYNLITSYENAELIKYGGNNWFYFKVIYMNMLYDLAQKTKNADFDIIKEAMSQDPRIGITHLNAFHKSGRGAGGHCFVKDFECFIEMTKDAGLDANLLESVRNKNLELLKSTNKDEEIIKEIYDNL
ncbi:MAG: NAD(P)-binding domain-containing protein [Patescibacteria group bacterium]|nr:NAD(P)-binding domain-containing protein [Patescibacteria group bacterium]MDD4304712.1 NAD(P)-binding domain-containing protein [Patescibacteria group bacterium]MDD4695726.1 NAD(P)-binding domain-containing protein [Patescibacteria group bacterium]